MTRYIENIDILFSISIYVSYHIIKKIKFLIYRDIFHISQDSMPNVYTLCFKKASPTFSAVTWKPIIRFW